MMTFNLKVGVFSLRHLVKDVIIFEGHGLDIDVLLTR